MLKIIGILGSLQWIYRVVRQNVEGRMGFTGEQRGSHNVGYQVGRLVLNKQNLSESEQLSVTEVYVSERASLGQHVLTVRNLAAAAR